jgi:hypothetical protein
VIDLVGKEKKISKKKRKEEKEEKRLEKKIYTILVRKLLPFNLVSRPFL